MTDKKLKIVETVLRDAHQSLAATRMRTEDMLPILEKMDQVGYHAIECWGGATFDACLRFLDEDPWDRLRALRKGMPNSRLQMLLRGQNLLGYRHYADDVVEYFVQKSIANGIDVIRIFDCLKGIYSLAPISSAAYLGLIILLTFYLLTSPSPSPQLVTEHQVSRAERAAKGIRMQREVRHSA